MTKRQLIDEILSLNHTAEPGFLARFGDADLNEYLVHLRLARLPRLRGGSARYEHYFRNAPTIDADVCARTIEQEERRALIGPAADFAAEEDLFEQDQDQDELAQPATEAADDEFDADPPAIRRQTDPHLPAGRQMELPISAQANAQAEEADPADYAGGEGEYPVLETARAGEGPDNFDTHWDWVEEQAQEEPDLAPAAELQGSDMADLATAELAQDPLEDALTEEGVTVAALPYKADAASRSAAQGRPGEPPSAPRPGWKKAQPQQTAATEEPDEAWLF